MFLNLMEDEYHLELIIYCICLYVGGVMCCNGSKMPKNRVVSYLATPPTEYDMYNVKNELCLL